MQIGLSHQQRRATLRQTLADLQKAVASDFPCAFEPPLSRLDAWTARIAAVGQVKAGKSSILNALIGQGGFLPADVNPWTSVVTNLCFNLPDKPENGARFEFFDDASWDRIINGDPRTREAAEQFMPGFDPEVLRAQTEEMRAHAERRLGPAYQKLLGACHDYDLCSPELLEHYVCAGPGTEVEDKARKEVGRYAAITKSANLYLRSKAFKVPTILTDTPGVNDPFLVRDELTCQSLDNSDIFLVMLSAHQALTEVDVALVRMLTLNRDKDVILYINRVDELEDASERSGRVVDDVAARISEAVGEDSVRILYGSAFWAEAAMDETISEAELEALIRETGVEAFNARRRGAAPASAREKLLCASGLNELKRALSDAIDHGSGARFLDAVAAETRAQVAAIGTISRRRRRALQDQIEVYGAGRAGEYKETLEKEMRLLAESHAALDDLIETFDEEADVTINDHSLSMQQRMDGLTGDFILDQQACIDQLWRGDPAVSDMEIDLLPLRIALEDALHDSYAEAREALDDRLHEALEAAAEIAARVGAETAGRSDMDALPGETVAITFATRRKTLSLNFVSKRGVAFWKGKSIDLKKTIDGLKRLAAAQIFPSTSKMSQAFFDTMSERAAAGRTRLSLIAQIVEQSLKERLERLRQDQQVLSGDQREETKRKVLNRLRNDIEVIDNRLHLIAAKETSLTDPDRAAA